jgi:hypothetical protein
VLVAEIVRQFGVGHQVEPQELHRRLHCRCAGSVILEPERVKSPPGPVGGNARLESGVYKGWIAPFDGGSS